MFSSPAGISVLISPFWKKHAPALALFFSSISRLYELTYKTDLFSFRILKLGG